MRPQPLSLSLSFSPKGFGYPTPFDVLCEPQHVTIALKVVNSAHDKYTRLLLNAPLKRARLVGPPLGTQLSPPQSKATPQSKPDRRVASIKKMKMLSAKRSATRGFPAKSATPPHRGSYSMVSVTLARTIMPTVATNTPTGIRRRSPVRNRRWYIPDKAGMYLERKLPTTVSATPTKAAKKVLVPPEP
jgi:hypothetical protein